MAENDKLKKSKTSSSGDIAENEKLLSYKELLERNVNIYCMNTVPEICPDHHYKADAQVAAIGEGMLSARIPCLSPTCEFVGLVNMNKAKNWNTSNFYKHLRGHLKVTNSSSISNFFPKASKVNPAPLVSYSHSSDEEPEAINDGMGRADQEVAPPDVRQDDDSAFLDQGAATQ